jgi:hypothetical protein
MTLAETYLEYLSELGSVVEAGPNRQKRQQKQQQKRRTTTRERQRQRAKLTRTGYRERDDKLDKEHELQQKQATKTTAKDAQSARRQRLRGKFGTPLPTVDEPQQDRRYGTTADDVIRQERIAQARRRREAANKASELARQKADVATQARKEQQQRTTDAQPNRSTVPPSGPPEAPYGGRFGGGPEYDYSDTAAARGGKAFAGAVTSTGSVAYDRAKKATLDKYKSRKDLRREVSYKRAKRRIPRQALRELEDIINSVPKDQPDREAIIAGIRQRAAEEEEDINKWREEEVYDIKSQSAAVKSGWKAGKKRGRKSGRGEAAREIIGAIPRAYTRYRNVRDQVKASARQQRDYERAVIDNRTRSLDRRVDTDRLAYLRQLKTQVLQRRWNSIMPESLSPREVLEAHKHSMAARRQEHQKKVDRRRLKGISRHNTIDDPKTRHKNTRGDKSKEDRFGKDFSSAKDDESLGGKGRTATKSRGGRRKKTETRKRYKSGSYHVSRAFGNPNRPPKGDPSKATLDPTPGSLPRVVGGKKRPGFEDTMDIGPSDVGGRNINPKTGKPKKRYYTARQVTDSRYSKARREREERQSRQRDYEPYKPKRPRVKESDYDYPLRKHQEHLLEVFGKPMTGSSMIQKNAMLSTAKKDKPQVAKPMMKSTMKPSPMGMKEEHNDEEPRRPKKASDMGPSHAERKAMAKRSTERSRETSSLGQKAKSAAGKVARVTGADELANVPRSVHQKVKHDFIHNFLLR